MFVSSSAAAPAGGGDQENVQAAGVRNHSSRSYDNCNSSWLIQDYPNIKDRKNDSASC
jgi:hypothetical protein